MNDKALGMYFKVPGDVEITVSPDQDTLHDMIEQEIEDGATHLEVVISIHRKETLN
jgi:hypothetical protein